jgi:hypothetical protein
LVAKSAKISNGRIILQNDLKNIKKIQRGPAEKRKEGAREW